MKIRTTLATTGAIIGMAFAGSAFAAETPSFEDVDTNKDGEISEYEAAAVPNLDFAAADVNQDGMLSRSEYEEAIS